MQTQLAFHWEDSNLPVNSWRRGKLCNLPSVEKSGQFGPGQLSRLDWKLVGTSKFSIQIKLLILCWLLQRFLTLLWEAHASQLVVYFCLLCVCNCPVHQVFYCKFLSKCPLEMWFFIFFSWCLSSFCGLKISIFLQLANLDLYAIDFSFCSMSSYNGFLFYNLMWVPQ